MFYLVLLTLMAAPKGVSAADAFAQGRFEDALRLADEEIKTANDVERSAIELVRGQCLVAMQRYDAATQAFTSALRYDPQARLDIKRVLPSTVGLLDAARERLRARLDVPEPGATVWFDGLELGTTPFTGNVAIGRHRLELRDTTGVVLYSTQLVLRADATEEVRRPVIVPPPMVTSPSVATSLAPIRSSRLRPWAVVSGAVGVGAGVASAVFLLRVSDVVKQFNGDGMRLSADESRQLRARGRNEEIAGFGLLTASLVALTLATVFWLVEIP